MSEVNFLDLLPKLLWSNHEYPFSIKSFFFQESEYTYDGDNPPIHKIDVRKFHESPWDPDLIKLLSVTYDNGYGGAQAPRILIHTENHVYFLVTYDGSTWYESLPLKPPSMPTSLPIIGGE